MIDRLHYRNKILIMMSIFIVYSYAIEKIFFKTLNLTPVLMLLTIIYLFFFTIKEQRLIKINYSDSIIFTFIIYSLLNGLINNTVSSSLIFIYKSVIFYYIGRYILTINKDNKYILYVMNTLSYIVLINIGINYFSGKSNFRITIEGTHPVAIGELVSFFIVSNYVYYRENKKIINGINALVGLLMQIIILGSRGAFLSSIITIGILEVIIYKKYIRLSSLVCIVSTAYYLFNINSEVFIEKFPTLSRIKLENILKDPSLIGGSGYIGRADVMKDSIQYFNKNPLFGCGLGKTYAHNFELDIISNLGIIGALIIIALIIAIILEKHSLNKVNILILGLFIVTFVNRQSSFAYDAHKNMFLFFGMLISSAQYYDYLKDIKKCENIR